VAIGFRFYGIIRRRRAKRLLQHGIRVDAVVTGIEESKGLKIDGRRPWYVTCKGRTPADFAGVTFRSEGLWNYGAGSPHPGETVWVYVDRADPSRYFVMAIQPGMMALTGSSLVTLVARYSIPLGIALFFFWTPNETWAAARQALYDHLFPSSLAAALPIGQPIIDILAHALFLAANHRFLLIVAAVGAVFVVPKKLIGFIWLFALLNIFFGTYVSSFVLDTVGVTGPAQITGTYGTSAFITIATSSVLTCRSKRPTAKSSRAASKTTISISIRFPIPLLTQAPAINSTFGTCRHFHKTS